MKKIWIIGFLAILFGFIKTNKIQLVSNMTYAGANSLNKIIEKKCIGIDKNGYTLTVVVNSIRNKNGRIQMDLYKNQTEYDARFSDKERRTYLYKKNVVNGTISYTYKNVPAGIYGVAILDDETLNGKMDYGWILPSEGFGFGDYWHTKWRTPTFNDFKFNLQSDKTVVIKVKYL